MRRLRGRRLCSKDRKPYLHIRQCDGIHRHLRASKAQAVRTCPVGGLRAEFQISHPLDIERGVNRKETCFESGNGFWRSPAIQSLRMSALGYLINQGFVSLGRPDEKIKKIKRVPPGELEDPVVVCLTNPNFPCLFNLFRLSRSTYFQW